MKPEYWDDRALRLFFIARILPRLRKLPADWARVAARLEELKTCQGRPAGLPAAFWMQWHLEVRRFERVGPVSPPELRHVLRLPVRRRVFRESPSKYIVLTGLGWRRPNRPLRFEEHAALALLGRIEQQLHGELRWRTGVHLARWSWRAYLHWTRKDLGAFDGSRELEKGEDEFFQLLHKAMQLALHEMIELDGSDNEREGA